jgi:hypothetical protein
VKERERAGSNTASCSRREGAVRHGLVLRRLMVEDRHERDSDGKLMRGEETLEDRPLHLEEERRRRIAKRDRVSQDRPVQSKGSIRARLHHARPRPSIVLCLGGLVAGDRVSSVGGRGGGDRDEGEDGEDAGDAGGCSRGL